MNTNDIREHLLSHAPWVDLARTVDTVKAGDATREVRAVLRLPPEAESLRARRGETIAFRGRLVRQHRFMRDLYLADAEVVG